MLDVIWLVLLFPLLGFVYIALFGGRAPGLGRPQSEITTRKSAIIDPGYVACGAVGLSFVAGVVVLAGLLGLSGEERSYVSTLYTWVVAGGLSIGLGVLVDPLSALMVLVVTGVGCLIHVYSLGYMAGDPGYRRFFAYMNLFVLAMLTLVLADSFPLLLVGWGGVGFTSYALIAHWYQREDAARAGVKAFVVNSIGDVGLMLGILLIFKQFDALDYRTVFGAVAEGGAADTGVLTAITLLLLVGAAAKSAQFPLHVWLPDAMAGPTPVSALIHAATMVTAGVYLIARTYPLFQAAPVTLGVVAVIGAFTALLGATMGVVQPNIKRVLAYSTISQLGYMFLSLGVGGYTAALFHLTMHAFFKALLFLAAGMVIHALAGEEELFRMGRLRGRLPVAYWGFLLGALAMAGLPGLSGFFSKDEILALALFGGAGWTVLGVVALLVVALTAFYTLRAFLLAFSDTPASEGVEPSREMHRPGWEMAGPVVILTVLAALGGYLQFAGSAGSFAAYLAPVFERYGGGSREVVFDLSYWLVSAASAALAVAGLAAATWLYLRRPALPAALTRQWRGAYDLLLNGYYLDALYRLALVRPLDSLARLLAVRLDENMLDRLVNGLGRVVVRGSNSFSKLETGYIQNYLAAILLGAVLILAFLLGGRY